MVSQVSWDQFPNAHCSVSLESPPHEGTDAHSIQFGVIIDKIIKHSFLFLISTNQSCKSCSLCSEWLNKRQRVQWCTEIFWSQFTEGFQGFIDSEDHNHSSGCIFLYKFFNPHHIIFWKDPSCDTFVPKWIIIQMVANNQMHLWRVSGISNFTAGSRTSNWGTGDIPQCSCEIPSLFIV